MKRQLHFAHLEDGTCEIVGLPRFLAELLRQIPAAADPGPNRAARNRLFPRPIADPADPLARDWTDHVAPELRRLFRSATATVEEDLRGLEPQPDRHSARRPVYRLRFPSSHAEAWLNALNQARIVIAERIGFEAGDRDQAAQPPDPGRALALVQMDFYALLQEWLLEGIA